MTRPQHIPPSRPHRPIWTASDDAQLRLMYLTTEHIEIGHKIGRTEQAVRNRCYRLGLLKKPMLSQSDRDTISELYQQRRGGPVDIAGIARSVGRSEAAVSKTAAVLGLTDRNRSTSLEHQQRTSAGLRAHFAKNGHPRGSLGMRHTPEALEKISEASARAWRNRTPLDRELMAVKRNKTMIEQYGSGNPSMQGENAYSRCRRGRREDLNNIFFRSAWEANYARYLNFLKVQGEIADWEYEPLTFVFHGEIRGVISYLPDFRVTANDGTQVYHEVKGWMTSKDRTKLARMKKHYPAVVVRLVDESVYKPLARQCAGLIPHWEGS